MFRLRFTILAIVFGIAGVAAAEVKPHALFGDHMVLQQGATLPIWGTADAGEEVFVQLSVHTARGSYLDRRTVDADKDGKWRVNLAACSAGRGGVLTISGSKSKEIEFKDVAVGEVWICSGQSNMEWTLALCPKGGGPEAIKNSANANLRMFTVPKFAQPTPQGGFNPKPPNDKFSRWLPSEPDNAPMFSAVAYWFGRDLEKALNVPVGLIHTSWGGTPAEAWTSKEVLAAEPGLKYYVDNLDQRTKSYDANKARAQYEDALAKWKQQAEEAKKANKPVPNRPGMAAAPGMGPNDPSSLYNGMIAPLLPFAIRGAIWYQGESNAGKPIEYRTLFADMIVDWRKRWGYDFPFYCVQLAPWHAGKVDGENWAYLREAQGIACDRVKNAGVAVITDVGDKDDIHPQKKEPVGGRLALLALAKTYGQRIEYSGPAYKSMRINGDRAILSFDHLGTGLSVGQFSMAGAPDVGNDGRLVGFTIAGEDKVFHPADALIEGNNVVVWSSSVARPSAVRYGWQNFPIANLVNRQGLPASPFRTDNFEPPFKK